MRNPWEWEEEDIELLIHNGVQESLTLDYKRCASLDKRNPTRKTELSKDVSAFANSAGGMIIYGVIETNHLPTGIDVGYDPTDITREWIEQVINSTIQRRIDGIRIKQIELRKSNPGRVIYVVHIPQSRHAPHMAEDHIFYKRFNYQSIPMEEYEVRDVAGRADAPDLLLKLYLDSETVSLEFEEDKDISKPISLNASVINESATPAMYYVVRLYIDKRLTVVSKSNFVVGSEKTLQVGNAIFDVNSYSQNYGIPGKMPIWQGVAFRIFDPNFQIAIPKFNDNVDYVLGWSVDSPGMQQKVRADVLAIREDQAILLAV